jgi:hypothetical protein
VEHFIVAFISSSGLVVRVITFRAGGCRFEPQSLHFSVVSSDEYLKQYTPRQQVPAFHGSGAPWLHVICAKIYFKNNGGRKL